MAHRDVCAFFPACASKEELRARHGTPVEFRVATMLAYEGLMVTWEEAHEAILRYVEEYEKAP